MPKFLVSHKLQLSLALSKMKFTRKKKTFRYQEQEPLLVEEFKQKLLNLDKTQCIYLDESGFKPSLHREYGCKPEGEPIFGSRQGKREKKLNVIAGLSDHTLKAPFFYQGTMNSDLFNIILSEYFVPELKPGQIVIMDNASFHKSLKTKEIIEEKGCQLWFLPPYSPELNPIEQTWASLKRYVKRFRGNEDSLTMTLDYIFQSVPFFSRQNE